MAFISQFTGEDIDRILAKGNNLKDIETGCIRLESSTTNPVDLNTLTGTGVYLIDYWTNGPEGISDFFKGPLIINVFNDNDGSFFQFIQLPFAIYGRIFERNENEWQSWEVGQTNSTIQIGGPPPDNPQDEYIWIDSKNSNKPILKIYSEEKKDWKEITTKELMPMSIYDPQNKATDLFKYADDKIAAAGVGAVSIDFNEHITNNTIHVTEGDKTKWNGGLTSNELDVLVNNLKAEMRAVVLENIGNNQTAIQQLDTLLDTYKNDLQSHINNTAIHPSAAKMAEWDNKADKNHKHLLDNSITVNADQIEGIIPIEKIDRAALERVIEVQNDIDRMALTKERAQNGDSIYVADSGTFYFVIDDTKLDSEAGYKQFGSAPTVRWENVQNKPNTLSGYGITDAYTKPTIDGKINPLTSKITSLEDDKNRLSPLLNIDQSIYINAITKLANLNMESDINKNLINKSKEAHEQLPGKIDQINFLLSKIEQMI